MAREVRRRPAGAVRGKNRERMAGLATQDVLARTRAFNEAGVAASRAKRLQKERAQAASASGERDERKLRAEDYYRRSTTCCRCPSCLAKRRAPRARAGGRGFAGGGGVDVGRAFPTDCGAR